MIMLDWCASMGYNRFNQNEVFMAKRTGQSNSARMRLAVLDDSVDKELERLAKVMSQRSITVSIDPKTSADLPEGWKDKMLELGARGESITSIYAWLGITHTTHNTLLETSPDYARTYAEYIKLTKMWWECQGNRMTKGGAGNAGVYAINVANRFGWKTNKAEVIGDPSAPVGVQTSKRELSDDELKGELESRGLPTTIFEDK